MPVISISVCCHSLGSLRFDVVNHWACTLALAHVQGQPLPGEVTFWRESFAAQSLEAQGSLAEVAHSLVISLLSRQVCTQALALVQEQPLPDALPVVCMYQASGPTCTHACWGTWQGLQGHCIRPPVFQEARRRQELAAEADAGANSWRSRAS